MNTTIANHGIFRRAVKSALGDIDESIITFMPTQKEAEETAASLNKVSDNYFVHPIDEFMNKVLIEDPKQRFAIGTKYNTRGKHPRECTVTDFHVTRNLAGEIVRTRYVSTHNFIGQVMKDLDVVETTIAMGLISTPELPKIPDTTAMKPIPDRLTAERLFSEGAAIFAIPEMDEEPIPVTSMEMLNSYAVDDLFTAD
jgi:hypothetical protein